MANLNTHLSGIEELYSKDFTARVSSMRLRPFVPAPVHNELDVFASEEQETIVSLHSQCIYDAVVLYFNALKQVFEGIEFLEPRLRCGAGYWRPGREIVQQMKEVSNGQCEHFMKHFMKRYMKHL